MQTRLNENDNCTIFISKREDVMELMSHIDISKDPQDDITKR
jgi:hypothetical protein